MIFYDRHGKVVQLARPGVELKKIDRSKPPTIISDEGIFYVFDGRADDGRLVYRQWPPRPPAAR